MFYASVRFIRSIGLLMAGVSAVAAAPVAFKERCLSDLVAQVPPILASQDRKTGRFGSGIWIVGDQNVMLPLAVAWSFKNDRNPYYHKSELLDAIVSAGDALIDDQDAPGQWVFRKKDGSTWGKIYMPWTYSRWIRAYSLVRDAMPAERRARWEKALRLGYGGIAKELATPRVTNIAAHHAMGLYIAGMVFADRAWREQAQAFLHRVAESQHPDGYWSEHVGPVVNYGIVYVDALAQYFAVSKDESVRQPLRKAAMFHLYFTYPDGSDNETVDERNPYHSGAREPNLGFTFTPEGRSYVARQLRAVKSPLSADTAASLLLSGEEGEGAGLDPAISDFDYVLPSGTAAVRRRGPWFLVASAITAEVSTSRWIQDRQNFVSVYHDRAGLILGGGNTKLQPGWSNFTIGDPGLLRHREGDENPKFLPPAGLVYVPSSARLLQNEGEFGVELDYGGHLGRIRLKVAGPDRLEYEFSGDDALTAHVTVLPRMGKLLKSAAGGSATIGAQPVQWEPGAGIEHAGFRLLLPPDTTLRWPVLPHDPYKKDGAAEPSQGRIVLNSPARGARTLIVEVPR